MPEPTGMLVVLAVVYGAVAALIAGGVEALLEEFGLLEVRQE